MLRSRKTLFTFAGVLAILVLGVGLIGRLLLDGDRYRSRAIAFLQQQTGKPVEIGHLRLTLFPLGLHVENFGLRNTAPFPPGYIIKAARIDAGLDAHAFWRRHVVINTLSIDGLEVNPTSDPEGPWNFENPASLSSAERFTLGEIGKVQIKGAQLVASNLLPSNAPGPVFFEAHDIVGEFDHMNVDAIMDRSATSMGGQGHVTADRLSFGAVDASNLSFRLQLWARQVFLGNLNAEVYGGKAAGALFFDLAKQRPAFRTFASFEGINVVDVLDPFENGRGKMSGKMEGDLTLAGVIQHTHRPLAGIRGSGHVTVRQGRVPSIALNENLMRLVRFNNRGPAKDNPASFRRISTDLELANLRITSKSIDIDGYGVDVDASGSLNVDGSDEIAYRGEARITTKQGFFTNSFARFKGAKVKDGLLSFPFRVDGTIESPAFAKAVSR